MTEIDTPDFWDREVAGLLKLGGPTLSVAEASKLMQRPSDEIEEAVREDRLLGILHRGELHIPMAQLVMRSEPDRLDVVEGIEEVLALMAIEEGKRDRHVRALQLLSYRHPAISLTPFEALRNGRKDRVLRLVKAYLELDQLEHEAHEYTVRIEGSDDPEKLSKAYIFAKAVDVFGSSHRAIDWLRKPALALGRQRPMDLLESAEGLDRLKTLLIQLDYSVYI